MAENAGRQIHVHSHRWCVSVLVTVIALVGGFVSTVAGASSATGHVRGATAQTGQVAGIGSDFLAKEPGITAASGSFTSVSPGISETDSVKLTADTYTLQLNTNAFSTPLCNGMVHCNAWVQFAYQNGPNTAGVSTGVVEIDSFLFGYTQPCPSPYISQGQNECLAVPTSSAFPGIPVSRLADVSLSGAVTGGSLISQLRLKNSDGSSSTWSASLPDSSGLSGQWNSTQFGIYGGHSNSNANFGANTTLEAVTSIVGSSAVAPTCGIGGLTAEGNNLNLAQTPALGTQGWSTMASLQTNTTTGGTPSCSMVATAPPSGDPTTTTVSAPSTATYGSNKYTATVSPTDGQKLFPVPTGTVSFTNNGSAIPSCQGLPLATVAGAASSTCTATLAPGAASIKASYSGASPYLSSTSLPFAQAIQELTSVVISGKARAGAGVASTTLIATVSSQDPPNPGGTVSFAIDGSPWAGCQGLNVSLGTAFCTPNNVPAGVHSITATYSGDTYHLGSTSAPFTLTVTGVTVTASQNPASPVTAVTYTATVSQTDGGGTVSFADGFGSPPITGCEAVPLDSSDSASCTTTLSDNSHDLIVAYSGDATIPKTSFDYGAFIYGVSAVSAPTQLTGSPFVVAFGEPVTGLNTADVTLDVTGTTTVLPATISCTDASNSPVNCATGSVSQAAVTPTNPLAGGWSYTIGVDTSGTGVSTIQGSQPVPSTSVVVAAPTNVPPTVSSTSFLGSAANPTIVITGSGFGSAPPLPTYPAGCGASGQLYGQLFYFQDVTGGWDAGEKTPQGGMSCIGLVVTSWSNTSITFSFGDSFPGNYSLNAGDSYSIQIFSKTLTGTVSYAAAPKLALQPTSGVAGTTVTASGQGFKPLEKVKVSYQTGLISPQPTSVAICTGMVATNGSFSCTGKIPAASVAGAKKAHKVTAFGGTSHLKASTTFTLQ